MRLNRAQLHLIADLLRAEADRCYGRESDLARSHYHLAAQFYAAATLLEEAAACASLAALCERIG